ncbi:MAG: SigB/SigF/SigG family RNA polymerase sigma factor [Syntrophomonadaceae bacterium]|nr:SigB/SigF/SigG family RNA polymerase sigma factor [Syntrophomonadaceae bacterium]MDD3271014.1 SigB/SigF/SigG family RNA polymerase sigma factor [Syntrophomonadaceae bacterium]MDD3898166.1 SigB/SigF/SigG family RNA polymerase sigma factor [Syntrophomonadaceae bacterium]MDD4562072.1 SigB/SigF/SigG family RNA polymerase sigma factor [Syntrophomonadaceae bacterium]
MSSPSSYQDNEALLRLAQQGDIDARDRIYEANVGLIYMVLERFKNSSYDYEDLFQVGSIGLLKAIDKFDFSFNVRFSTYAVPMIIGEIKKFLRDDGIVKVQRNIKETYTKIRWAQDKLRGDLGREPGVNEIASLLEIDKEDIVVAMEACQAPAYMHDAMPGEEKVQLSLIDRLANDEGNVLLLEKLALREALGQLEPREQEVILRRFFKDETQSCIADDLGVSQVQISRIEKRAINKLKQILE